MSLHPAPKHIRDKFKAELEQIIAAQPKPVVFLPLMTKPAKNPFEGIKYLPDMWKPNG